MLQIVHNQKKVPRPSIFNSSNYSSGFWHGLTVTKEVFSKVRSKHEWMALLSVFRMIVRLLEDKIRAAEKQSSQLKTVK